MKENKLQERIDRLDKLSHPERLAWYHKKYNMDEYPLCNCSFLVESKWTYTGGGKSLKSAIWNDNHIFEMDDVMFEDIITALIVEKQQENHINKYHHGLSLYDWLWREGAKSCNKNKKDYEK
jgi:hypothetical protein